MRKGTVTMMLLLLLSLAGCSTLSITSDYDSSIDFGAYRSYRWKPTPDSLTTMNILASSPIVGRRVRSSVDREMAARGYTLRERGPVDFMVSAAATVRQKARLEPDPVAWDVGYYRGRPVWHRTWWSDPWSTMVVYEEGSLMLDITDVARKELVWRGIVRGLVEDFDTPERMQERLDEAVRQLLSKFPPVRR